MNQYLYYRHYDRSVSILNVDSKNSNSPDLLYGAYVPQIGAIHPIKLNDAILTMACNFARQESDYNLNGVIIHTKSVNQFEINGKIIEHLNQLQDFWFNQFSKDLVVDIPMLASLI
jgi:hypothetical protein